MPRRSDPQPPESRSQQELELALARETRISRALREVGNALGTTLDLDDLLELILDKLTDLLDADRATLYLLDEARAELVSRIVVGSQVRSIRVKVGNGIAGSVAETGQVIRVADAYVDPRFEPEWDLLTGYKTTSMLVVPLKNHLGRTIGVIQVLNKLPHGRHQTTVGGRPSAGPPEFDDEDEAILLALSTQAAVAIDNSRLFLSLIQKNRQLLDAKEQLERGVRDLSLLYDLERALARAGTMDDLARASLEEVALACGARGAAMMVAEEETGDLLLYAIDLDASSELGRFGVKSGEGFLGAAMRQAQPIVAQDAEASPFYDEHIEGRYSFPVESVIAIQLGGERAFGSMGLFSKRDSREFTDEDIALLKLVGANVTTAVRLFRVSEARERSARLTTIGRLLSGVIHDFKTPMTVISGYVQLMQASDDTAQRGEYCEAILDQFDTLSAMQREVLEFARGERTVFVRKVYLHKFFSDIRRQLQLELEGRPVELEMDIDTKLVARFDEGRVARAVHNLARNAIEAMSGGGRLTISAKKVDEDLVLGVADTGPGVPQEIEGRLFQSFVTSGKEGGTGLGLAIVKKIVEEHGGSISVRSDAQGAKFELRFPESKLPQGGRKAARKSGKQATAKPS